MSDLRKLAHDAAESKMACPEFAEAANNYLNAIGTDEEKEAAKNLVVESEECLVPIDVTIKFLDSKYGVKRFGEEKAAKMLKHAKEVKENGGVYCDCDACVAAKAIIDVKEEFLK